MKAKQGGAALASRGRPSSGLTRINDSDKLRVETGALGPSPARPEQHQAAAETQRDLTRIMTRMQGPNSQYGAAGIRAVVAARPSRDPDDLVETVARLDDSDDIDVRDPRSPGAVASRLRNGSGLMVVWWWVRICIVCARVRGFFFCVCGFISTATRACVLVCVCVRACARVLRVHQGGESSGERGGEGLIVVCVCVCV